MEVSTWFHVPAALPPYYMSTGLSGPKGRSIIYGEVSNPGPLQEA